MLQGDSIKGIALRPADPEDEEFVYAVTEAAMRGYVEQAFGPWNEREQRRIVGRSFDRATHYAVLVRGVSAGVVALCELEDAIRLDKLYLWPGFQRQGIGSRLLQELTRYAASRRKPVRLRVLVVNRDARRLYERHGFVVTEETPLHWRMEHSARREAGGALPDNEEG